MNDLKMDALVNALEVEFDEPGGAGLRVRTEVARTLMKSTPPLTETQLEAIASKIAERYIIGPDIGADKEGRARRAKEFIFGILVGLTANGLYSLLLYLSTFVANFAGTPKPDGRRDTTDEQKIRNALTRGLPIDLRRDLERSWGMLDEAAVKPWLRSVTGDLENSTAFNELFMPLIKENDAEGIASMIAGVMLDDLRSLSRTALLRQAGRDD